MSLFSLDTDTLSLLQHNHPAVSQRVKARPATEVTVTIISVEEQLTGWQALLRQARRADDIAQVYERMTRTVQFLAALPILSCTEPAVLRYDTLKALKLNVGKMDLRSAAIALEAGATVVTRNLRDFGRVPGLAVEDWSV